MARVMLSIVKLKFIIFISSIMSVIMLNTLKLSSDIINRLEKLAKGKHSSLVRKLINKGRKKFYVIKPWAQCYKTFLSVIYEFL